MTGVQSLLVGSRLQAPRDLGAGTQRPWPTETVLRVPTTVEAMSDHTRESLAKATATFLAAFNSMDLDGVLAQFADDGIYEEFNGNESKGLDAVRSALTPQFEGAFGDMMFIDEDLMIDPVAGKVMASWRCTLVVKGEPTSWRGLDAMTFDAHGKITHKLTYAKAKVPLFE